MAYMMSPDEFSEIEQVWQDQSQNHECLLPLPKSGCKTINRDSHIIRGVAIEFSYTMHAMLIMC